MRIILAGYNIDADVLGELMAGNPREDATPETLSAAYARISRNPKPVDELRRISRAEVSQSRRSNKTIIFEMGHHSVAEHAVFNFDLISVSRLALEAIEHFRLCSFTEKSQRYISLKEELFIPREIVDGGREEEFTRTVTMQQTLYKRLSELLQHFHFSQSNSGRDEKSRKREAKLKANEDARYILPLAMPGQVGMTVNARNLELILRRFSAHPLDEIRAIGNALRMSIKDVAPSLMLFTEPSPYDLNVYEDLTAHASALGLLDIDAPVADNKSLEEPVKLLDCTPDADVLLLASILHHISISPFSVCREKVSGLSHEDKKGLILTAFRHVELYDTVLREFEFLNLRWELLVSASCFAQLKRHRMASMTIQDYSPRHGVTLPPAIENAGGASLFLEGIAETEVCYDVIVKNAPAARDYVLTNAHRRRVHFACNARDLYHFCRLREDIHAQWDIRQIAQQMHNQAAIAMPLAFLFLAGKDAYPEHFEAIVGHKPGVLEATLPGSRNRVSETTEP